MRDQPTFRRGRLLSCLIAASLVVGIALRSTADDNPKPDGNKKDVPAKSDAPKGDAKPDETKPEPAPSSSNAPFPETAMINRLLAKAWVENNVKPSRRATDYEFVRRIYLDLLGRIASADEVRAFLNDQSSNRRQKLVNKLLRDKDYAEEYANNFADIWTTLLLSRAGNRTYHEQMHLWVTEALEKNHSWDRIVRELVTATGQNNDNGAVNYLLAHLGEPQRNRDEEGMFDFVPITSRTIRLFLGVQIQCTQCHDHPHNPEWKQSHFWGVNAFFRQSEREGTPQMRNNNQRMEVAAKLTLKDNPSYNRSKTVYYEKRIGVVEATGAKFIDGRSIPADNKKSRRETLADYIVSHDQFAKAYVNRLWGHFFGRGLNQQASVDDFGEHNEVVHRELLDSLAASFKNYKYDIKQLIEWICNSDAYSLSVVANATNSKPDVENLFSRMLLKTMTPEQLFESLMLATNPPQPKKGSKTKRAVVDEARKKARQDWMDKLVRNFGDDEGNEVTFNGTIVQALLMMNGREINSELSKKDGAVGTAITRAKGNKSAVIRELFLMALNREPTSAERSLIEKEANRTGVDPLAFFQDVYWALLNSNEFILNH